MKLKILCTALISLFLVSCATENGNEESAGNDISPITVIWHPSESATSFEPARNYIASLIEEAVGREVVNILTTDSTVAIEQIANGTADIAAIMGPMGYIMAQGINPNLSALVVNSGPSGTLEDAIYYSWIAVRYEDSALHETDGRFSIENIQNSIMGFVSQTSASGFIIPSEFIINTFSHREGLSELETDDFIPLLSNINFFEDVVFAGSHPAAVFSLLNRNVDVAAFNEMNRIEYFELTYGQHHTPGAVYTVLGNAQPPFDSVIGESFRLIAGIPIQSGPFVYNPSNLSPEEVSAIRNILTTDSVAENPLIFAPADGETGLFRRDGNERFIAAPDSWWDPMRYAQ